MEPHKRAVLALTQVSGLGNSVVKNIVSAVPDVESVFSMPVQRLMQIEDIGETRAKAIRAFSGWDDIDGLIAQAGRAGASLLTLADAEFPALLRQIYDPPPVLWLLGDVAALDTPGVAVVGTRSPTPYGKRVLDAFLPALLEAGLTVYSGLAYGIDTLAHKKTVEAGGKTVAVLGSGIDRIYPASNTKLAKEIVEKGGAVITECIPGAAPDAGNFPARNRIVSGLSRGVFVVESAVEGGSMITARVALDQSRDVFAAPHPVDNIRGTGCNTLIRDGLAKLVISPEDILTELNLKRTLPVSVFPPRVPVPQAKVRDHLSASQMGILTLLDGGERHIDELSTRLSRDIRDLNVDLFELEMEGFVRQLAGKRFVIES
jgi:DNA processing protein